MQPLLSLFFTKQKATIRNLLRKPSAGLLTGVAVLAFVASFIPLIFTRGKLPLDAKSQGALSFLASYAFGMIVVLVLMQKTKSLFFIEDSYYLFIGPYSQKNVLKYELLISSLGGLLYGAMCIMTLLLFSSTNLVPWSIVFVVGIGATLIVNLIVSVSDWFYLREMISGKKSMFQKGLMILIAIAVVGLLGLSLFNTGFDISAAFSDILSGDKFDYIPFIGWLHYLINATFKQETMTVLLSLGALLAANFVASFIFVNTKGHFFEQAMIDAENFTEFYKNVKKNREKTSLNSKKVRVVKAKFGKGSNALFSKNLLIMRKTNSFLRFNDIMMIVCVVLYASLFKMGFIGVVGITLLITYSSVNNSTLSDDLKHHYIYLLPDSGIKKMIAVMKLPLFKAMGLIVVSITAGGFIMKTDPLMIAQAIIVALPFAGVFAVGNGLSIRLLGSRSSVFMENIVKMVYVMIALAPTVGILWLMLKNQVGLTSLPSLVMALTVIINIVVIVLGLMISAPMMNGHNIESE